MTAGACPLGTWRNRILGSGEGAPDQLAANPRNWRTHPAAQRKALRGALDTVGWVQQVIVNRRTGNVVDGLARIEGALSRNEPLGPRAVRRPLAREGGARPGDPRPDRRDGAGGRREAPGAARRGRGRRRRPRRGHANEEVAPRQCSLPRPNRTTATRRPGCNGCRILIRGRLWRDRASGVGVRHAPLIVGDRLGVQVGGPGVLARSTSRCELDLRLAGGAHPSRGDGVDSDVLATHSGPRPGTAEALSIRGCEVPGGAAAAGYGAGSRRARGGDEARVDLAEGRAIDEELGREESELYLLVDGYVAWSDGDLMTGDGRFRCGVQTERPGADR